MHDQDLRLHAGSLIDLANLMLADTCLSFYCFHLHFVSLFGSFSVLCLKSQNMFIFKI